MFTTSNIIDESGQKCRLTRLVPELLARIPLYQREHYPTAAESERSDCELDAFLEIPFITKSDLRIGFPKNFLGEDGDLDSLLADESVELEHTSGTSEERTPLLLKKGWWLEQEMDALRLNSFVASVLDENPRARRITINSPTCNNDICYTTVPSRDERIVGDSLSLSLSRHPFLWNTEELERMAAEAVEWNPVFLDLDPVYGVIFAIHCEKHGIKLPALRFVLCSYEYVSDVHRRILSRVFGVPVLTLYGATESGHLLMEDAHGGLVPSTETAYLEIVHEDVHGIGRLVTTTFTNEYMPLLRYQLGDLASVREISGHEHYFIHGREKDSLHLADGRRITTRDVDACFASVTGIIHYQLVQQSDEIFLLKYVADVSAPEKTVLTALKKRIEDLLDANGRVTLAQTDLILPEGSGKFRLLVPKQK
jgi:phenylacetate-coenzyme A ligase PaaK-like adenylate-forming protein